MEDKESLDLKVMLKLIVIENQHSGHLHVMQESSQKTISYDLIDEMIAQKEFDLDTILIVAEKRREQFNEPNTSLYSENFDMMEEPVQTVRITPEPEFVFNIDYKHIIDYRNVLGMKTEKSFWTEIPHFSKTYDAYHPRFLEKMKTLIINETNETMSDKFIFFHLFHPNEIAKFLT
jgi:hypothetical protein